MAALAPSALEPRWSLSLYIVSGSARSARAVANLTRICAEFLPTAEVEVVDLTEDPGRARSDDIVVTPSLVRRGPPPPHKVIGDLSDVQRVLAGLGVGQDSESSW